MKTIITELKSYWQLMIPKSNQETISQGQTKPWLLVNVMGDNWGYINMHMKAYVFTICIVKQRTQDL